MTLETPILNETPVSIYHPVCIPGSNIPISYPCPFLTTGIEYLNLSICILSIGEK